MQRMCVQFVPDPFLLLWKGLGTRLMACILVPVGEGMQIPFLRANNMYNGIINQSLALHAVWNTTL